MFEGFKKWWRSEEHSTPDTGARGPIPEVVPGDWVVVPYRVMEACRVSMATVGAHPDLPDHIRLWITQWLSTYNRSLASYMVDTYGPDIFPIIDGITAMVRSYTDHYYSKEAQEKSEQEQKEFFDFLEKELGDGGDTSPGPTATS